MKTLNFNLEESMNLKEIEKSVAIKEFKNGADIYVKLSTNMWLMFNNKYDTYLTNFDEGIKCFVTQEFDDDKVIVTRHKNIAEYFRKVKGINARCIEYARPEDVHGKIVYGGTIAPHLMSFAEKTYVLRTQPINNVDFDSIPYDQLDKFGLEIKKYVVTAEKIDLQDKELKLC